MRAGRSGRSLRFPAAGAGRGRAAADPIGGAWREGGGGGGGGGGEGEEGEGRGGEEIK